jgi:hypothetical protein
MEGEPFELPTSPEYQRSAEALPPELCVRPWPDEVVETLGFNPRSMYVETTGNDQEFERGESATVRPDAVSAAGGPAGKSTLGPSIEVAPKLMVRPLVDPVVDRLGFPVMSAYVEGLWLSVLGPSATWALRRLGAMVTARPDGVAIDLAEFGLSLGLGSGIGSNSSIVRTVKRLVSFRVAAWQGNDLLVRRVVAPLTMRQLARLSPSLVALHHRIVDSQRARSDR